MDLSLFQFLNGLAGYGAFADSIIVFCASYLQYILGAGLIVIGFWMAHSAMNRARSFRMISAALISAVIARLALKPLILIFVYRARPYVALQAVHNIVGPQLGEELQSFPSGHALVFFAIAMTISMYHRRLGWTFFAGASLMGIARIAGGIHWPSDILGGALIGSIVAWLLIRLIPALRPEPLEKAP